MFYSPAGCRIKRRQLSRFHKSVDRAGAARDWQPKQTMAVDLIFHRGWLGSHYAAKY
jgi:hypothetical protein